MAASQNVGQTTPFTISYLDQSGSPMLVTPIPDAPPQWSQTNASAETLTAAADGNTASVLGLASGSDTVKVDLKVNGVPFSATIDMTVNAVSGGGSQTLTSIAIVAGTPTP